MTFVGSSPTQMAWVRHKTALTVFWEQQFKESLPPRQSWRTGPFSTMNHVTLPAIMMWPRWVTFQSQAWSHGLDTLLCLPLFFEDKEPSQGRLTLAQQVSCWLWMLRLLQVPQIVSLYPSRNSQWQLYFVFLLQGMLSFFSSVSTNSPVFLAYESPRLAEDICEQTLQRLVIFSLLLLADPGALPATMLPAHPTFIPHSTSLPPTQMSHS